MGAAVPETPVAVATSIDAEGFKVVADRLVEEAGVHADAPPPVRRADRSTDERDPRASSPSRKAGREAILAKRVIDATGDADVATAPGARTRQDAARGDARGVGDVPRAGVDKDAFLAGVKADPQTYARLGRRRRMGHRDDGQGGRRSSRRSCASRSSRRSRTGVMPADLITIAGTWGAVTTTRASSRT